jgi:cytochrome c oxidase subunit 2
MPLEIKAVPMAEYLAWVKVAQANYTENTAPLSPISSPAPVNELADASNH